MRQTKRKPRRADPKQPTPATCGACREPGLTLAGQWEPGHPLYPPRCGFCGGRLARDAAGTETGDPAAAGLVDD